MTPHPILSAKNRSMIAFTDLFLFIFAGYLFLIFQLPYQQLPLELADKVIENQKEVHRMTFLSPYVLPVAQVV